MTRPRVFLDISVGNDPIGRLTIELFTDKTPKTCENFRQLCTGEHDGLSYAQTPFHRVIDEFMIQGGDVKNGDGTGRMSIYGGEFEDEDLHWREVDAAGLVCSANSGKRDGNGSQFFITLEACPHLNGKFTIFGRVVAGEEVLRRIAEVETDGEDHPRIPVLVSRCGELEKKKKKAVSKSETGGLPSQQDSRDRGRRRRSTDRDVEMEDSPEPRGHHKHRRQSDNVVDEGLRGRPRQRSRSRSHSHPPEDQSEDDNSEPNSPDDSTKLHKRKRSPSPSRGGNGEGERRRRSLPNQYRDDRFNRVKEDEERYRPSPRRDDYRHQHQGRRREDDRYRPGRDRVPQEEYGRLGGGDVGEGEGREPPVKFKGRGVMKFREPDRW